MENSLLKILTFSATIFFSSGQFTSEAYAQDAKSCIKIGFAKEFKWYKKNSKYITNICNKSVHLIWCHAGSAKPGTKRSVCGGKKYYRSNTKLKPGERKFNQYSVPNDATIYFGACFGGYFAARKLQPDGKYACKIKT